MNIEKKNSLYGKREGDSSLRGKMIERTLLEKSRDAGAASNNNLDNEELTGIKHEEDIISKDARKATGRIGELALLEYKTSKRTAKELLSTPKTIQSIGDKLGLGQTSTAKNGRETIHYSPEEIEIIAKELGELAPPGYRTINELVEELHVSSKRILAICNERGLLGREYRTKKAGKRIHYSPEEIEIIAKELGESVSPKYKTINGLQNDLHANHSDIKRIADELNLGKVYKDNNVYYSPEEIEIIAKELGELAPPEYKTVNELKEELHISVQRIKEAADRLNLGEEYRAKNGRVTIYYSPEEIEIIAKELGELAPPGYKTANELIRDFHTSHQVIEAISKKDGLGKVSRRRNGEFVFFSPEDQEIIARELGELAPPSYKTVNDLKKELHTSVPRIKEAVDKLNLGREYRAKTSGMATYYSPEEKEMIVKELGELAPTGYKTVEELLHEFHTTRLRINDISSKYNLGRIFRTKNGEGVYYSIDEQAILKDLLSQKNIAKTSIAENTVAFYLIQSGLNIEQNIRPDWLHNPDSGYNLEVDVFIKDLGAVAIEYDGWYYHQDAERDIRKDQIAKENGYTLIRIRESGCPELLGDSICIKRLNNRKEDDFNRCLKELFRVLNIPLPDIDVKRDRGKILKFMEDRMNKKNENGEMEYSL